MLVNKALKELLYAQEEIGKKVKLSFNVYSAAINTLKEIKSKKNIKLEKDWKIINNRIPNSNIKVQIPIKKKDKYKIVKK